MKQYIKLFSLILIPYLSVSKTLRQDLQDFFINLKIKLTGKYPTKKLDWEDKNSFLKSVIIDIDTKTKINRMTDYQKAVDYIKNTYPDKEDQDALIKIIIHNIYISKAKRILKKSLFYGSSIILGVLAAEGSDSFKKQNYLKNRNLQEIYIPRDVNVTSIYFSKKNNDTNQQAGAESKFYSLFLEMIGFLDDSVKSFLLPLLSNIIDQILSFLLDPKIDPRRVLIFFLVNTVLVIFGLLFNKIKRQMKNKNLK